jgi:hypothetical protein
MTELQIPQLTNFIKIQAEVPSRGMWLSSLIHLPVGYLTILSVLRLYCIGWQDYR